MRKWRTGWGWGVPLAVVAAVIIGCADNPAKLRYLGNATLKHYKNAATEIDYPAVESGVTDRVMATEQPRAVNDPREDEIRDLTLAEAIDIALQNCSIIRSRELLTPSTNRVTSNPDSVRTIYDPAIQGSGVLFGGRGVESALSQFDPSLTSSMIWGRNELIQNNQFGGAGLQPGSTLVSETGAFNAQLQKVFANGGTFAVSNNWNYLGRNVPNQLFPSVFTGVAQTQYSLPLLSGSGTEYTRIAGPAANSFGGISGVNQGVVIARINNDITIADFELAVRNLLKDVEDAYWDLYLQYRLYDTAVKTRNSTLEIWRKYKIIVEAGGDLGGAGAAESVLTAEPQARQQYYENRASAVTALGNLYNAEVVLRRLMGIPTNDGSIIRPADEPPLAEFVPDWEISLVEALTNRAELRRQKFNVKSLELQLRAARSLTRPQLNFVSGYNVNAFGNKLFSRQYNDGRSSQGLNSAVETLTQGNQTGWNLGFQLAMPIGFRSAHAQVRNVELRLAKARDILAAQELDVSHELALTFQDVATRYAEAQANFNQLNASEKRVEIFALRGEITQFDLILRAKLARALAESAFYTNMANYAKSIAAYHFAKGDLLEFNNVNLAESMWTPRAYDQALRRAVARSHALGNPFLRSEPADFTYPAGDRVITVEPGSPAVNATPELEDLPLDLPAGKGLPAEPPAGPMPDAPLSPLPTPAAIPKNETPPLEPVPMGDAAADNYPETFMDRQSSPASPADLSGGKVGALKAKPASKATQTGWQEQTGYFQEHNALEKPEKLELDAQRDLLQ